MAESDSCSQTSPADEEDRALIGPKKIWKYLNSGYCSACGVTPETIESLFKHLKEDKSVLNSGVDEVLSDNLQELTLPCIIKIIHLIHSSNLSNNQYKCQVDVPSLLKRFLEILSSREECQDFQTYLTRAVSMLNAIPQILDCEDTVDLQAVFIGVNCFDYLIMVLECECENPDEQNLLYKSCVRSLQSIMEASPAAKEVFKARDGYGRMCGYLQKLKCPSKEFIQMLFDWVVEGVLNEGSNTINNIDVVLLLLDWLPFSTVDNRRYVTEAIRRLCLCSIHNAILCSTAGVFSKTVALLNAGPKSMDYVWAESLIGLLEALGSHSVASPELKQMISLFTPLEDGTQVPYALRLLQALVKMSFSGSRLRAKHFFDLQDPSAGISVPGVQKWPGSSCTFHAWICVEALKVEEEKRNKKAKKMKYYRRNLYSFFTISGLGLEAFLSTSGHLVVAVCNKKHYTTVTVPNCQLCDQKWHSVTIAHSRRSIGQSTVSVYVDGELKISCPLKFPSMSEELASCHIGCGGPRTACASQDQLVLSSKTGLRMFPFLSSENQHSSSRYCSTIAAGTQDQVWGVPTSLQGQLGPACVFRESLQERYVTALHAAGPNDLNLFQPVDATSSTQAILSDLTLKLVLYFNAKAGRDHTCSDLVPIQQGRVQLHGRLTGHRCTTWDIKDVLRCIGGMKIFLPLLEQVCFFDLPKRSHENSEQPEIFDLEQSPEDERKSIEKW